MKAIFISFNQAYEELIFRSLGNHNVRGYTSWSEVRGCGSTTGDPHLGSHAWPTLNGAILTICPNDKISAILADIKKLDEAAPEQGIRAFVWDIVQSY